MSEVTPDERHKEESLWRYPNADMSYYGMDDFFAVVVDLKDGKWSAKYWRYDSYPNAYELWVTIGTYDTRGEAEVAAQVAFDMGLYYDYRAKA